MSSLGSSCVALGDARKLDDHENSFVACSAVSHVDPLFASGFDVRVERQRVLDEATVFQIHVPPRDHVTTLVKFVTCEVAVGERLFELLSRLHVVGRLPSLDFLGDRGQFIAKFLARVLLDERADFLEEQARVVRLIARGLASSRRWRPR
jgi:hypothetical protein